MTLLRRFFDAAIAVDPAAAEHDEGLTMRYCTPDELRDLLSGAGLDRVVVSTAEPSASYAGFEDLWAPLEAGIGPSGKYVVSLDADQRSALKSEYRSMLNVGDEPFTLTARAWVATGIKP